MQIPLNSTLRRMCWTILALQLTTVSFAQDNSSGLVEYTPAPFLPLADLRAEQSQTEIAPRRLGASRASYALPVVPQVQPPAEPLVPPAATSPSDLQPYDPYNPRAERIQNQSRTLDPLPTGELSLDILLADISVDEIGTREIPKPAWSERADPRILPDGYARGASAKLVNWCPSGIWHYPLRFEEPMLERHGHVRFGHLQSLASGAKFFTTIPLIPYLYTLRPSCEPVYALGNWRVGSCAPLLKEQIPWDRDAAIVESLTAAAFFWAAPL